MKGKHLVLVSTDMAEAMRQGQLLKIQSEDGREYRARHTEEPGPAERAAYFSQLGEGAPKGKFKYQAADEAMEVEDDWSPGSASSGGRSAPEVRGRRSPPVDPVAAAGAAIERERLLRERERQLASRERELRELAERAERAERQHILQYEREYERVYDERQRHLAAHPYYPRLAEREVLRPQHQHWDPRVDPRLERAGRHPIVYATRPPRSITPRGPPRSSSR